MYKTCCDRYMSQSSPVSYLVQFYNVFLFCLFLSLVSACNICYDDKKCPEMTKNYICLSFCSIRGIL